MSASNINLLSGFDRMQMWRLCSDVPSKRKVVNANCASSTTVYRNRNVDAYKVILSHMLVRLVVTVHAGVESSGICIGEYRSFADTVPCSGGCDQHAA